MKKSLVIPEVFPQWKDEQTAYQSVLSLIRVTDKLRGWVLACHQETKTVRAYVLIARDDKELIATCPVSTNASAQYDLGSAGIHRAFTFNFFLYENNPAEMMKFMSLHPWAPDPVHVWMVQWAAKFPEDAELADAVKRFREYEHGPADIIIHSARKDWDHLH